MLLLFLFTVFPLIFSSNDFKVSDLDFSGSFLWKDGHLKLCDQGNHVPNRHLNALRSYRYFVNYEWVNVEVLSVDPPIVKYGKFLKPELIELFLEYTKTQKFGRLLAKGKSVENNEDLKEARVIDGVFVKHNQAWEVTRLYNYIQHRIDAFDLSYSDKFLISRFETESHQVPQFDYLKQHHDLDSRGNRMATMMFVLKNAQFGGATIFPSKSIALNLEVGDALVWLNMGPKNERLNGSLRGECPVIWGEKLNVFMWIRSKGQEFRYQCPLKENKPFSLRPLIKPKRNMKGLLLYELDVLMRKLLEKAGF